MIESKREKLLESLGLSAQEARCYVALVELQEARTGPLCRACGIPSSHIYSVLESLMHKGLASYRVHNNVKVFRPASAEALRDLFEQKQKRMAEEAKLVGEMVNAVKGRELGGKPASDYKYFEGLQGVKAMWHEINGKLAALGKSQPELIYGAKREGYAKLLKFYDEHHALRNKAKVPAMILLNSDSTAVGSRRANRITQVRYAPLNNAAEWGVIGDFYYTQYVVGGTPRAFLICDKVFADSYRDVFEQVWKRARAVAPNA